MRMDSENFRVASCNETFKHSLPDSLEEAMSSDDRRQDALELATQCVSELVRSRDSNAILFFLHDVFRGGRGEVEVDVVTVQQQLLDGAPGRVGASVSERGARSKLRLIDTVFRVPR